MNDTDKILIGTVWTRARGEHSPVTGSIDQVTEQGVRLKLDNGSHRKLKWVEVGFGWEPKDRPSEKRWTLWQLANKIDYLDKKADELKEIEVANNGVVEVGHPEAAVKECHGPWHKGPGGKHELVPLSEFRITTKGPIPGHLAAICNSCWEKQKQSDRQRKVKNLEGDGFLTVNVQPKPALEAPIIIEPGVQTESGTVYRWKVTVVQPTEHYVQAKDFLDAAAQVAALGEVTKVEKL